MQTSNTYAAALEAVIFDWAGTLVDYGSLAPTQIFVEAFGTFGIELSLEQARGPMGLSKWQHIKTLLDLPEITGQWLERTGRPAVDSDVDAIYARFMPMQIAKVGEYSQAIEGASATLAWLRSKNLKIGSCSGYPRQVLEVLLPLAAKDDIAPDYVVAGDELAAGGRPGPYMALANVLALEVGDVASCVKVDDTVPGIQEGMRAGMWAVGVSMTGNEVGQTREALSAMSVEKRLRLRARAESRLREAGAHYVIDSVAELPSVVEQIIARLEAGERP